MISVKKTAPLTAFALLAGASLLFTGCGGGNSGSASAVGGSTRATVLITDSPRDDFAHVWATIYQVELVPQEGSTPVVLFDDASGRLIDLKTLRDAAGARYSFLAQAGIPAGTYTGVNVTIGATMQLMKNGTSVGNALTVDESLGKDTNGHPVVAVTFKKAKTLGGQNAPIVVDFDLARFVVQGNKISPALAEGDGVGMNDPARHESDEYHGTVSNLSGTSPALTFTLTRGNNQTVTVMTTESTALFGSQALAEGSVVDVSGTLDTTTQALVATQVEVQGASATHTEAAGNCTPRVVGAASSIDATAGTFSVTPQRAHGLTPTRTAVSVSTSATTTFRDDTGATISSTDFFTALAATTNVIVEGAYDSQSGILIATSVRVFDPAHDGGGMHEKHRYRGDGSGAHWGNGAAPTAVDGAGAQLADAQ